MHCKADECFLCLAGPQIGSNRGGHQLIQREFNELLDMQYFLGQQFLFLHMQMKLRLSLELRIEKVYT